LIPNQRYGGVQRFINILRRKPKNIKSKSLHLDKKLTMIKKIFLTSIFNLLFYCDISAQLQLSAHFGIGEVSKKVENITTLSSGGQYVLPTLQGRSPYDLIYFDADLTYYFKNDYAINFGVNSTEVSYYDEFEPQTNQKILSGNFWVGHGPGNSTSFSITASKKISISKRLFLIPETGLGLMTFKKPVLSSFGTSVLVDQNTRFLKTTNRYTSHINDGIYLAINFKLQYQIFDFLAINAKTGYQLHFNEYHTKNTIEYTSTNLPNEIGRAEYKYTNLLFFSLGTTLQLFDKNGKFQLFKSANTNEESKANRPKRVKV
jgi:hypothetical protein